MIILQGHTGTYHLTQSQGTTGKFGGIYKGHRQEDNCPVSAKRLKPDSVIQNDALKQLLSIHHPSLAATIEIINDGKDRYIIRKYYAGTDLKTILNKGSLYRKVKARLFTEMAIHILDGLSVLHQQGMIHRDIKPANIIIQHREDENPNEWTGKNAVLIDFEQASLIPCPHQRSPFALVYSPPEQLLNKSYLANASSDLFALAITLYECVAGKAPYQDCNAEILLNLQLTYPVKKPPRMDENFFNILAKAAYKESFPKPPRLLSATQIESILQKGIVNRYQTAEEMKKELQTYIDALPSQKKHPWYKRFF